MSQRLPISGIQDQAQTHARVRIDSDTVREYAECMRNGATFPPIQVCGDGTTWWVADGWHRLLAAKTIGLMEIDADVVPGEYQDAVWLACAANTTHGLRRSHQDKRRAVEIALNHPHANGMSTREIADHCGVSHMTVWRMRGGGQDAEESIPSPAPSHEDHALVPTGVYQGLRATQPNDTLQAISQRAADLIKHATGIDMQACLADDPHIAISDAWWRAVREAMGDGVLIWRPVKRVRKARQSQ